MNKSHILIAIAIVCVGVSFVESKFTKSKNTGGMCKEKSFKGCKVEKGECVCSQGTACDNPFPYKSHHQCSKDLKGDFNKCKKEPCAHGACVQLKMSGVRRWGCACAGSGYYGNRCENKCPEMDIDPLARDFPTDCIY